MQYNRLGDSGIRVSQLVLGTLNIGGHEMFRPTGGLDQATADRLIGIALDAGVNMIDTADFYSAGDAERIVGRSLKDRRDDVLIASKARFPAGDGPNEAGLSRHHLIRAVDASLSRLGTDHLDLLYLHQWDGETPLYETLQALDQLIRQGKVRYTGVSNFSAWQVTKTVDTAREHGFIPPIAQQIYYTPEAREAEYEILPAAADAGLGSLIWSPLGEGLLTGAVRRGTTTSPDHRQGTDWPEPHVSDRERALDLIEVLAEVAGGLGVSIPRVVLSWTLGRPHVSGLVIGARNETQLTDNLDAADFELPADARKRIDEASQPAALYPFWHRAMLAADRPDPAEEPYLEGYRSLLD